MKLFLLKAPPSLGGAVRYKQDIKNSVVLYGILLSLLIACKPYSGKILTSTDEGSEFPDLLATYKNLALTNVGFVLDFYSQAKKNPAASTSDLQKQHKLRSFLSYAIHSRCFMSPRINNAFKADLQTHRIEKSWRDRHDYNYYHRGDPDYTSNLRADPNRICYIILDKMTELTADQIDLTRPNMEFFNQVRSGKVKSLSDKAMTDQVQKFFREELAQKIIDNNELTMARADLLFPFHKTDYVTDCQARRDWFGDWGQGPEYRYSKTVRDRINCQALQRLPTVTIKVTKFFPDLESLTAQVIEVVNDLNTHRQTLDNLVREQTTVVQNTRGPGTIERSTLKNVVKERFFLWHILNKTNLQSIPVLKAYDDYNSVLLESAKSGILPLLFTSALQKETGSLHLTHTGRLFGFGKVEYEPLRIPNKDSIEKALQEAKRELVDSWVEIQATRLRKKDIEEKKVYEILLNYEIATAQIIMQNPEHAIPVTHLMRKFQHQPILPKWLRTYKNIAFAIDLAFIPIIFLTGGVGTIPILLMANAVNFLWIGVANSEMVLARNRYRLAEKALLTGNSDNVKRGLEMLGTLHDKQRNLIMSAAVGGTLTMGNLGAIAKGLDGKLGIVAVDITAAITSDIETLAPSHDDLTDADIQKQTPKQSTDN